jgi:hypothetical protein
MAASVISTGSSFADLDCPNAHLFAIQARPP